MRAGELQVARKKRWHRGCTSKCREMVGIVAPALSRHARLKNEIVFGVLRTNQSTPTLVVRVIGDYTHLDVVCHDGDVSEVEGGVDLIHDVQRSGLVVVQREHQRQRAESL